MRNTSREAAGFTLIELMVTLAIIGTLVAVAIPSFQQFSRSQTLTSRVNALHQDLGYARAEAVKFQQNVRVDSTGKGWTDGWQVYADANADGDLDSGERVLRTQGPIASGYKMTVVDGPGNAATGLGFDRRGGLVGRGAANVAVCAPGWTKDKDETHARNIRVMANGRAEAAKGKGNGTGVSC